MGFNELIVLAALALSGAAVAAPVVLQEPQPVPPSATEGVPSTPQANAAEHGDQLKAEPHSEAKTEATQKKAARRSVRARHRAKRPPASGGAPRKIVVREGGVDEPATQIVTNIAPAEATRRRQDTEQLLNSTGEILKRLATRPLDAERQETVTQVRNYVGAARAALKEGDISRASTLASKASLLAEDLEKH